MKIPKPAKPKKARDKRKQLKNKADKLWYQKYLKSVCEICGDNYHLQAHHFYYRSSYGHLRYLEDNHITLCQKHHFVLHHQDPKKITDRIIEVRGQKWYDRLKEKALTKPKPSYQTIGYYKKQIEKLK